jgi:hypothetical protein
LIWCVITTHSNAISQARNAKMRTQLWVEFPPKAARDWVPYRPNRLGPRRLKRRPKNLGR